MSKCSLNPNYIRLNTTYVIHMPTLKVSSGLGDFSDPAPLPLHSVNSSLSTPLSPSTDPGLCHQSGSAQKEASSGAKKHPDQRAEGQLAL